MSGITESQNLNLIRQLGCESVPKMVKIAGDGGDRAYHRLTPGSGAKSDILMQLGRQDRELLANDDYDWLHIGRELADYGIRTPTIKHLIPEDGFIILEDFGDQTLEAEIKNSDREHCLAWYSLALDCWLKMSTLPVKPESRWRNRSFDEEKLDWELQFLFRHLLQPLNIITNKEKKTFDEESLSLAKHVAGYRRVFTHRDYHSRNIMVLGGDLGIIDFQDARMGPISYDLVSLCFDSYVDLAIEMRLELIEKGCQRAEQVRHQWPATLLQRQLKALGSFGFLGISQKKQNFLKYLSPASTILRELEPKFSDWPFLSKTLIPRIHERAKGI